MTMRLVTDDKGQTCLQDKSGRVVPWVESVTVDPISIYNQGRVGATVRLAKLDLDIEVFPEE